MRCVTDANIWIDLDNGGLLGRVFDLGDELYIPDLIFAELETPDTALLEELGLKVVGLTGSQLAEIQGHLAHQYNRASVRDLSALVYARDNGVVLVTGDGPLRAAAREEGVEYHGVVWILDRLVAEGVITRSEASHSLRVMVHKGARLPREVVQGRLRRWRP